MHRRTGTLATLALLASMAVEAQPLAVSRAGSRAVVAAPAATFAGNARIEMLFDAREPSHAGGGIVTFEPGARTAWHTHPRGQILIVTAGVGRAQRWGDPIEEIRTGDVVRIPAGQKHWHGASPLSSMTHLAISEHQDGTTVQWMEQVSDAQYNGEVRSEGQPPPASPVQSQASQAPSSSSPPSPSAPASAQRPGRPSGELQPKVAPGMAVLTDDVLFGDVWRRPELSPRDRSLVTISVLIATGKSAVLAGHLGRALDNGVKPVEASGALAHLAVYSGWPNAVSALDVFDQVYTARKIDTATLRTESPRLAAPASDAARAGATAADIAAIAPKFVQLTNEVVFDDLWRRPDLSVRDRSLVTIAALAALGDEEQLEAYVRRGLESGLTREQIAEAVTHLGFYAGWSRATKAMGVIAKSFGKYGPGSLRAGPAR